MDRLTQTGPWIVENKVFTFPPLSRVRCPYCKGTNLDIEINEVTDEKEVLTCTCMDCRVDFYADKLRAKPVRKAASKNIRQEPKYVQRRTKFGLGKMKAPVRSRNATGGHYRPYTPLPKCPKCGAQTSVIDMKHNDHDEFGQLYENYRCPNCLCWFTITYDGPDDTYDWSYDE